MPKLIYNQKNINAADRLQFSCSVGEVLLLARNEVEIEQKIYDALLKENKGFADTIKDKSITVSGLADAGETVPPVVVPPVSPPITPTPPPQPTPPPTPTPVNPPAPAS